MAKILGEQLGSITVNSEFGGTEAIKKAIESGLGISCLPKITLNDADKRGALKILNTPSLHLSRQLFIITNRSKYMTAGINNFLDHCFESYPD